MIRMSLTSLLARRRRLAGTAVAIVLGVSFLSGTLVLGDTLNANFDDLITETTDGTDVQVRNGTEIEGSPLGNQRGLVDESLVADVRSVDGVATAEGQVVGAGQIVGHDGEPVGSPGPPRLAGSWVTNPELNPYRIVEGRAPETADEVVINRGAAKDGDLTVGDRTTVQTPTPTEVTIVGIATFGDADGVGASTWAAWTLGGAQQHVTGEAGQVSAVLVQGEQDVDRDELAERVSQIVPEDVEVITGSALSDEQMDEVSEFLDPLRLFLVVFAGIALVVATLSINNSFSVTVAQRTRELALLRAVGASRRQVRRIVNFEALLLGVGAAAVAVPLGWAVAGLLKAVFDGFGFALPAGGLEIRPRSVAIAAAAGVLATLVAAQAAARRSSRLAPLAALRETSTDTVGLSLRRVVAGGLTGLAGVTFAASGAATGSAVVAGLGALATVAATLILGPVVLPPLARVLGAVLGRLRGLTGQLAEQNTQRNPRRSAATGAALVVGVAVVTLITVLVTSIQVTFEDEAETDFAADLAVATPGFGDAELAPELVDELDGLAEVDHAVGLGGGRLLLGGERTTVTAADGSGLDAVAGLDVPEGSLSSLGSNDLAVSASRADDEGWEPGTTLEATFPDGASAQLDVTTVFEDNSLVGDLVIQPDLWSEHVAQPVDQTVLLNVAGADIDGATTAIEPLADRYGAEVQDREAFASATAEGLDLLLGVVYALLALAIIIALLGIGNTLALSVHERRHEIGLLRAVGQTRRQVRSVLRLESLIISTFGTLVGLALGGFLGWTLFSMVTADDGGSFAVPGSQLAIVAAVGALAGVLAAHRPARRASRLPVLEAIAG